MYPINGRDSFFHDLEDSDAHKWLAKLQTQPARGWTDTTTACGWEVVPSVYVFATQDRIIPLALQQQMAGLAQPMIESIDAGHMLQLSKTDEVAELIKKHAVTLAAPTASA